ncbi:MAG TPA: FTR1 family protein [Dehalococcoidia bacterium]|nr:FTR1 family protein [Dehalococcoidia bacterium]
MSSSFIITLREGLEAGLIVAIILAYLKASGQRPHFRTVLISALAAVAVSLTVGAAIFAVAGEFEGRTAEAFEGSAMLIAVGVLSWMVVWMKRQSAGIKKTLETDIAQAIGVGSAFALAMIPFTAILREGLETAVFLFAATRTATPLESTMGASAGILAAVALTWGIYTGGYRVNLRVFFNVTGVLLIILAAGLLVNGLKDLHEARVVSNLGPHAWDTYGTLADNSQIGKFLSTILGYDSSPYIGLVIAHIAYLVLALGFFAFGRAPSPRPAATIARPPVAEAVPEPEGS